MKLKFKVFFSIILLVTLGIVGCTKKDVKKEEITITSIDEAKNIAENSEVTIYMWGGNPDVNKYFDEYVAKEMLDRYSIKLKRVPMDAPDFMNMLINEKKGNKEVGNSDLIWINGENFKKAKETKIITPINLDVLNYYNKYYDKNSYEANYDSGVSLDNYAAILGKAQLILTANTSKVSNIPKSYKELLEYVKANKGIFTYPNPKLDFVGNEFIKTSYYELLPDITVLDKDLDKEEFFYVSKPVVDYFKELNQYLWQEGDSFPSNQAQLDSLYKNGEVDFTMGFEVGKTYGRIKKGEFNETSTPFVFNKGTVRNAHYLCIPFNAPNKEGALLTIDFLQSIDAQLKKFDINAWGDMPAFDANKLEEEHQEKLKEKEADLKDITLSYLEKKGLPELNAKYTEWINELWEKEIIGQK